MELENSDEVSATFAKPERGRALDVFTFRLSARLSTITRFRKYDFLNSAVATATEEGRAISLNTIRNNRTFDYSKNIQARPGKNQTHDIAKDARCKKERWPGSIPTPVI